MKREENIALTLAAVTAVIGIVSIGYGYAGMGAGGAVTEEELRVIEAKFTQSMDAVNQGVQDVKEGATQAQALQVRQAESLKKVREWLVKLRDGRREVKSEDITEIGKIIAEGDIAARELQDALRDSAPDVIKRLEVALADMKGAAADSVKQALPRISMDERGFMARVDGKVFNVDLAHAGGFQICGVDFSGAGKRAAAAAAGEKDGAALYKRELVQCKTVEPLVRAAVPQGQVYGKKEAASVRYTCESSDEVVVVMATNQHLGAGKGVRNIPERPQEQMVWSKWIEGYAWRNGTPVVGETDVVYTNESPATSTFVFKRASNTNYGTDKLFLFIVLGNGIGDVNKVKRICKAAFEQFKGLMPGSARAIRMPLNQGTVTPADVNKYTKAVTDAADEAKTNVLVYQA
jgi:hypothetical protein